MKVGIMGGTFNPVHNGHLFLAENAYTEAGLDKILFMPSKNPPHKNKAEIASDKDRSRMVALAIQDNPNFILSMMEMEREGTTYTADTLSILHNKYPQNEYYFIVGTDSLFMMENWKDPQTIFELSTILIANRDVMDAAKLEKQIEYLRSAYSNARIVQITMPTIQISSASIRDRINNKKSIRYYVPKEVMKYIEEHQLYHVTVKE